MKNALLILLFVLANGAQNLPVVPCTSEIGMKNAPSYVYFEKHPPNKQNRDEKRPLIHLFVLADRVKSPCRPLHSIK